MNEKCDICFLAPANNYHTIKWSNWFCSKGYSVHVISFTDGEIEGATVHYLNSKVLPESTDISKIKYFSRINDVRRIVSKLNPTIVSVHYASSYGVIAALAGIQDYYLSLWGSDIFEFPKKSIIHKSIIKYSLHRARHILSTSKYMAKEAENYVSKPIYITPFGVNTKLFSPNPSKATSEIFKIGIVKRIEEIYGIRYIIKALKVLSDSYPGINFHTYIAGSGSKVIEYQNLAVDLDVADKISWLGFITQEQAAELWSSLDIAVLPSLRESFGVAALEAQACGIPVIISDEEGLMEATLPGETSLVVPKQDALAIAEQIVFLYSNPDERKRMGDRGREFVKANYDLDDCFRSIEDIFKK